jgi:hypothetical protein
VFEDEAADGFDVGQEAVSGTRENHRIGAGTSRDIGGRLRIVHLARPGQCDEGRDWQPRQPALIAQAITDGAIAHDRDANTETNRILALTGLTPLLDLEVISPGEALAAIGQHLDELFTPTTQ